jgi:DNA-directed RNA polymerase subunit F
MNNIQNAKEVIKQELEKDEELRLTYQSNIAMLLHDRFDLTNFEERNEAANDILKLIFDIDGDFLDCRVAGEKKI